MAGNNLVSGHGKRLTVLDCALTISNDRKTISPNDYGQRGVMSLAQRAGVEVERFPLIDLSDTAAVTASANKTGRVIITGSALSPALGSDELLDRARKVDLHMAVLEVIDFCVKNNIPTLGICYGAQMIGVQSGAKVEELPKYHFGFEEVHTTLDGKHHPLFAGLSRFIPVAEHHGFGITDPSNLVVLATNQVFGYPEAIMVRGTNVVGVQFHPDYHPFDLNGLGRGDLAHYGRESEAFLTKATGRFDVTLTHSPDRYGNNVAVLENFLKM